MPSAIVALLMFLFTLWFPDVKESRAALRPLNDSQLSNIGAQAGPISFSIERNDLRIFIDAKIKTYTEIDRVRLGYYYKARKDLVTRKGLNPGESFAHKSTDKRVKWIPDYYTGWLIKKPHYYAHRRFRIDYGGGVVSPERYAIEYSLVKDDRQRHTEYIPWTDDDFYMGKYKRKWPFKMFVDGVQGNNNQYYNFSSTTQRNRNYLDWDININNLRVGNSPDNPMTINGLVMRLKYDNISSPTRKLTDIIIGSNDFQGDIFGDLRRLTGILNPRNAHRSRRTSLQKGEKWNNIAKSDLGEEFNATPIPVILQRDSMLMLVDHIRYNRDYKNPLKKAYMSAVPDNPTHNSANNGIFIRIGLDRNSPHFGYNFISGYNERVATAFHYRGEHLNESLHRWWSGKPPSPDTNKLTAHTGSIPPSYTP